MKLIEQQIVDRFLQLVQIDTPSYMERPMADYLLRELRELGLEVQEDESGVKMLGAVELETHQLLKPGKLTGNIIATLRRNAESMPTIMFVAHMDTVVSNRGVKPQVQDGVIRSDGKTVLGADDRAGICAIIEAIRYIKMHNIAHGDIQFVFTVAEETGLYGSRYLDMGRIEAKYAFVLDSSGPTDKVITSAPTEIDFTATVYGKAAHAGINPENGVNAIQVVAEAITHLKLGRIDEETTCNIGVIQGGDKTNIVADRCQIKGEVRSHNDQKITEQLNKIRTAFTLAGEKWGTKVDVEEQKMYNGYSWSEDDEVVRLAMSGLSKAGITAKTGSRAAGSDANNLNAKGIPAVTLGLGVKNDHTCEESIKVTDLLDATRLVIGIVQASGVSTEVHF